ncbi:hypothetical protein KL943_002499 [Ogataea angusta]|nr:hypothetical protein KL943_002499 [Ogataea angusta]
MIGSLMGDDQVITWRSVKYGETTFTPTGWAKDLAGLNLESLKPLDFVLLGANSHENIIDTTTQIKSLVGPQTIILVESRYCLGLEEAVKKVLPKSKVLGMICDADVRVIKTQSGYQYCHKNHSAAAVIGSSITEDPNTVRLLKGEGDLGAKLTQLTEMLKKTEVYPCYLIPKGINPTFNSYGWKRIIPFISLEVMSLVYSKLSTLDPIQFGILKGVFSDLLTLGRKYGAPDLPDPSDSSKTKSLLDVMIRDFNQSYPSSAIKTPNSSNYTDGVSKDPMLDLATCVHNFNYGHETCVNLSLKQTLGLATKHDLKMPYVEMLFSFFAEIQKLKEQNIFDWANRRTLAVRESNGFGVAPPQQQVQYQQYPMQTGPVPMSPNPAGMQNGSGQMPTMPGMPQFMPQMMYAQQYAGYAMVAGPASFGGANPGLVPIHPRFRPDSSGNTSGQHTVSAIKNSMYRKSSTSTIQSGEELSRSQRSVIEHANVKNMFSNTTSRYGDVDSFSRVNASNGSVASSGSLAGSICPSK